MIRAGSRRDQLRTLHELREEVAELKRRVMELQPARHATPPAGEKRVRCVVKAIDGNKVIVRPVKYAASPPVPGELVFSTDAADQIVELEGYPLEGSLTAHFKAFTEAWDNTGATPASGSPVLWAYQRGRFWLLENQQMIRRFKLAGVGADTISGKPWDGATLGPVAKEIAKPPLTRRTPFDGRSRWHLDYDYTSHIEREAHDQVSDTDETQVIVPRNVLPTDGGEAGPDIIVAANVVDGSMADSGGDAVQWMDLNADGRAWAKKTDAE